MGNTTSTEFKDTGTALKRGNPLRLSVERAEHGLRVVPHMRAGTLSVACQDKNHLSLVLKFTLDASVPCRVTAFFLASESQLDGSIDTECDIVPGAPVRYAPGAEQEFPPKDAQPTQLHRVDIRHMTTKYLRQSGDTYPLIIRIESLSNRIPAHNYDVTNLPLGSPLPRGVNAHTTFARFLFRPDGCWDIAVLGQRLWLDGVAYELPSVAVVPQLPAQPKPAATVATLLDTTAPTTVAATAVTASTIPSVTSAAVGSAAASDTPAPAVAAAAAAPPAVAAKATSTVAPASTPVPAATAAAVAATAPAASAAAAPSTTVDSMAKKAQADPTAPLAPAPPTTTTTAAQPPAQPAGQAASSDIEAFLKALGASSPWASAGAAAAAKPATKTVKRPAAKAAYKTTFKAHKSSHNKATAGSPKLPFKAAAGSPKRAPCVMCNLRPATVMASPCRHSCMCIGCALQQRAQYNRCPVCQLGMQSLVPARGTGSPQARAAAA